MRVIDAPGAWDAGYTGKGVRKPHRRLRLTVRVADLDSGIDPNHPDLAPNIDLAASKSFVPFEPFIDDLFFHGTWTAGIIAAADNEYGVIGVAPEATIINLGNPNYLDLIVSCVPLWKNPSGFFWNGGTGASAPHVSGVAALIIGQHGGDMQPAQVTSIRNARKDLIVVVEDD